jgi:hypothetical protein
MAKDKTTKAATPDTKAALTQLLKQKLPAVFEREPAAAYTPHLDTLVDEIINLIG